MIILKGTLGINDFKKIILQGEPISMAEETLETVADSFTFLKEFSENKIIYGVNTGFGPMAQYKIKDQQRIALQYNLIRSHASGSGKPIAPEYIKASLLARLNTLSLGFSGIHPSAVDLMATLINRNILPVIYEHGGVGASGDLVQLAHVALTLIGEGEVYYNGKLMSTSKVFQKEGLAQFTRPAEFRGWVVPDVLRSGDHRRVERWRRAQRLHRTLRERLDLVPGELDLEDQKLLDEFPPVPYS